MRKVTCTQCGEKVDHEESVGEKGSYLCESCYRESLTDCQLCEEGVEETEVSRYILVKTEFAETGNRLPGIYRIRQRPFMTTGLIGSSWLHGNDILFINYLPKSDHTYEISGNICNGCAENHGYPELDRRNYGLTEDRATLISRERRRVMEAIEERPEILIDLETDSLNEDLHRWVPLPVFAPTFRERLFLAYKDVRIYWTCGRWATWLSLRPEPSYRNTSCMPSGVIFAPSGLKTWEPIPLRPDRKKDPLGHYYDTGYRYGNEYDYIEAAKGACIRAIDQGLITSTHAPENAR